MEPRWCDRPFPSWLADPDCIWFRRTDRAIECVDLHGDFGLLGLECASGELAAVEAVPSIYSIVSPNDGLALRHGHHFDASGFCNRPWARSSRCLFRRIVPANLCKGIRMPAASTSPQRVIDQIRAGVMPRGVHNDDADRRPWARKRPFRTRPAERVVHPVCPCRATSGSLNRDNSRGMSQECAANAAR